VATSTISERDFPKKGKKTGSGRKKKIRVEDGNPEGRPREGKKRRREN
jgi:hypothetical protein